MKKIILGLGLLIGLSSAGMAQSGYGKGDGYGQGRHHRSSNCGICQDMTNEQKEKMKGIHDNFVKEKDAVLKSRITKEMQNEKIRVLKSERDKEISKLLTDEQRKQWEERKEWRDKKDHRKGFGRDDKRMMQDRGRGNYNRRYDSGRERSVGMPWMLAGIEMTDKQKEEYKKIADNHQKEIAKVREKHRKERTKIDSKQKDALKKILTDDQKKVFENNLKKIDERREAGNNSRR